MLRYRLVPFVLVAALIFVGASFSGSRELSADSTVSPTGISVDFNVEPMDEARTQFMCRAQITDLSSGVAHVINLQVMPPRTMTGSINHDSGEKTIFTASVGEGGTSASYVVEYLKGSILVAKQKGTISLLAVVRSAPEGPGK
jgi:hypothetical protein